MTKLIYIQILLLFCTILSSQERRDSGNRTPQIIRKNQTEKSPQQEVNIQVESSFPDEPVWKRIIYRELDLNHSSNAPLYYPVRPLGEKGNLLTTIFEVVCRNELPVYEYIDGYELFEERNRLLIKDFLDYWQLPYEIEETESRVPAYAVDRHDFPSAEVRSYYIKESWYVGRNSPELKKEIIAICPLLSHQQFGMEVKTPLFWIQYKDLVPFIRNRKVMTSDLNNSWLYTIEEYFRKGLYEGEIIKTENLQNKTLWELYPDPDSMRLAQVEIEKQLQALKNSLSWHPDSTKASKKQIKKENHPAPKATSKPVTTEQRSVPVRSVRRR